MSQDNGAAKSQEEIEAELEKQKEIEALMLHLKKRYKIRSFKTTTESLEFTRKIASVASSLGSILTDNKHEDITTFMNLFEPKLIEYVVGGFVMVKKGKKLVPVNYEKEFIGKFEDLSVIFMMTIKHLMQKATSSPKPMAHLTSEIKISSKKRQSDT